MLPQPPQRIPCAGHHQIFAIGISSHKLYGLGAEADQQFRQQLLSQKERHDSYQNANVFLDETGCSKSDTAPEAGMHQIMHASFTWLHTAPCVIQAERCQRAHCTVSKLRVFNELIVWSNCCCAYKVPVVVCWKPSAAAKLPQHQRQRPHPCRF